MKRNIKRIISLILMAAIVIIPLQKAPKKDPSIDKSVWNTNYTYVFVHGLSGWGSYDALNQIMPYWGMFGGNNMEHLRAQGFNCVAASVAPTYSAWDRACELYAQLAGTRVDYGEAHSKEMGHDRYGEDYTNRALIQNFDEENKINLVGHSFGGATIRLFAELMANGCEEEVLASGDNVSPLFTGGKADYIYSITTLAAPTNGTTAYYLEDATDPEPATGINKTIEYLLGEALGKATTDEEGRSEKDYASYDMLIDNALELNKNIETLENVYYFSIPCCSTTDSGKGYQSVNNDITDMMFRETARLMGNYTFTTPGGYVVDEKWLPNDGLVNTYSALAPFDAPQKDLDKANIEKGVWQIFPTFIGDHMSITGGLMKTTDVKDYYVDFMCMINEIEE